MSDGNLELIGPNTVPKCHLHTEKCRISETTTAVAISTIF